MFGKSFIFSDFPHLPRPIDYFLSPPNQPFLGRIDNSDILFYLYSPQHIKGWFSPAAGLLHFQRLLNSCEGAWDVLLLISKKYFHFSCFHSGIALFMGLWLWNNIQKRLYWLTYNNKRSYCGDCFHVVT